MRHDKAAQLLILARTLASSAEGLTLDEMAAEMEVGRRTAERMRDALLDLFPQLEELPDPPTKRYRIPNGLDGLFQNPTTEELVELTKAIETLRASGSELRADTLVSLDKKIRAAMRSKALMRVVPDIEALVRAETIAVQAGPRPFENEILMAKIRHGIMAMKALRFVYQGGSKIGVERDVTPFGIMFGRFNYLVGAELGSTDPKSYRLDRIENLQVLNTPTSPPKEFDLHDYAAQSFGIYQGEVEQIVLRVLPDASEDALAWRFHPTQSVEKQKDGAVIVRFEASGQRELAWHLFTWGDQIEIISPTGLSETMVAELKKALERHLNAPVNA